MRSGCRFVWRRNARSLSPGKDPTIIKPVIR